MVFLPPLDWPPQRIEIRAIEKLLIPFRKHLARTRRKLLRRNHPKGAQVSATSGGLRPATFQSSDARWTAKKKVNGSSFWSGRIRGSKRRLVPRKVSQGRTGQEKRAHLSKPICPSQALAPSRNRNASERGRKSSPQVDRIPQSTSRPSRPLTSD
jgi:hypothetical protein